MLNIENLQERLKVDGELMKKLEEALEAVTTGEGVEYETEVNLYFVDDVEMADINKNHREMEGTTDVLSFPLISYEDNKTYSEMYNEDNLRDEMFLGDSLVLGDVVISGDRAISQAEEYGHSIKRETVFLFVHSLLHLLGYDHMEDMDRMRMNEKEEYYMNSIGVGR